MAENGRRKGDSTLLLALAGGQTVRDAARSAGIGERTATRRAADPAFCRRVAELRSGMVARAAGQLADGMAQAVATLRELLTAESESVRLAAARSILEIGPKLRETVELEERMAAIEAQASAGREG
jgi:HEAT repeat protein